METYGSIAWGISSKTKLMKVKIAMGSWRIGSSMSCSSDWSSSKYQAILPRPMRCRKMRKILTGKEASRSAIRLHLKKTPKLMPIAHIKAAGGRRTADHGMAREMNLYNYFKL